MSYTPHNFQDGDVLYAQSLNEMEAWISGLSGYDAEILVEHNDVSGQFSASVSSGDVDDIYTRVKNHEFCRVKIVMSDLTWDDVLYNMAVVVYPWVVEYPASAVVANRYRMFMVFNWPLSSNYIFQVIYNRTTGALTVTTSHT